MKLSVIVPIYNAGEHLKKCLESIRNQSFSNYEVLMINDGSTDNSKNYAIAYSSQDSRFQYFEIDNSGVSSARNLGIIKSSGEYLTFVDSDDFLDGDHFQVFMNEIEHFDMVVGGYKVIDSEVEVRKHSQKAEFNRQELIQRILKDSSVYSFPWNKFFRRDIIKANNLLFRSDIHYGEDLIFDIEYVLQVKRACILNTDTYNYVQHSTSVSAFLDEKRLIKRMTDIDAMLYVMQLLGNNFPNEKIFLKERIAREGFNYLFLAVKYKVSQDTIKKLNLKINPYIKWYFLERKKDFKTLKFLIKNVVYRTRIFFM